MNIYSQNVVIYGTAYAKAENEKEARKKIAEFCRNNMLEVAPDDDVISGRHFNDPNLPDVSLSPAMTIHHPVAKSLDIAEENVRYDDGEGA